MNRWERVPMSLNEQMWCRMADTCKACSEQRQGECREAAERERNIDDYERAKWEGRVDYAK